MVKKVILGVDPGFINAGYAIVEYSNNRFELKDIGIFSQKSSEGISVRIGKFYDFFNSLAETANVTHFALETPFLGKNAQNFLKLGYLRGIINLISHQKKGELFEFSPREIKSSVTGFGAAEKEQVARALHFFFPTLKKLQPFKMDATDALAIALCGCLKSKS